jgi:hypothetical protein
MPQIDKNHSDSVLDLVQCRTFGFGPQGNGYREKLRWALFDPQTRTVHHGTETRPPGSATPPWFWRPLPSDIDHLMNLANWWRAVLKLKEKDCSAIKDVSAIKDGSAIEVEISTTQKPKRVHRLISEASPDLPPSGFFDCTVEVSFVIDSAVGVWLMSLEQRSSLDIRTLTTCTVSM